MLTLPDQAVKAEQGLLQSVANDLARQWDLLLILSDLHEEHGSPVANFWRWVHDKRLAPRFGIYDPQVELPESGDKRLRASYWAWTDTNNCHREWLYPHELDETKAEATKGGFFINILPVEVFNSLWPTGLQILNHTRWRFYPSWQDAMTVACTAWAASSYARRK